MTRKIDRSDGDGENPLDPLFRKIRRQWETTLLEPSESSSPHQEREGGRAPDHDGGDAGGVAGHHHISDDDGEGEGDDRPPNNSVPSSTEQLPGECFLILVQHSLSSNLRILSSGGVGGTGSESESVPGAASRTNAASRATSTASALYDRAGVRSPSEQAWRDLHGSTAWLEGIADSLARTADSVVWVQTLARQTPVTQRRRNVEIIDAARDPFGWNTAQEEKDGSSGPSLENLDQLTTAIQARVCSLSTTKSSTHLDSPSNAPPRRSREFVPVVVQSLTPILHRHGFRRTLSFVRNLKKVCPVLVVPIAVEALSRDQHGSIEVMASAVLAVELGSAVLLRRGVRESANVVREALELAFDDNPEGGAAFGESGAGASQIEPGMSTQPRRRPRIRRVAASAGVSSAGVSSGAAAAAAAAAATEPSDATRKAGAGTSAAHSAPRQPAAKSRVQLALSDDDAPRAVHVQQPNGAASRVPAAPPSTGRDEQQGNRPQPRIIVQDDDPEFDDYDDEDPDDDLDL